MRKDGCTMTIPPLQVGDQVVVEHGHFQQLLVALRSRDYEVVGPTVRDNAIVYDALTSVADLPIGYTDEQDGGTYRLKKLGDRRCSAMLLVRTPGKSSSILLPSVYGRPGAKL